MNILFGNQKGGVGKTTLCMLAANYIGSETDYKLTVLDFDFQLSIYNEYQRKKEVNSDLETYKVYSCTLNKSNELLSKLSTLKDEIIFIDSPGKLDDKNILHLIENSDLIIIPFSYEKKTFQSTYNYIQVVEKINPKARILLVPNKIKSTMRYHIKEKADEVLKQKGTLTDFNVPDLASLMRSNIFELHPKQKELIQPLADIILNNFMHCEA